MKKIRLLFLIIFSVFFWSFSSVLAGVYDNPAPLSEISAQIPELNDIKCKFKQEKTVQNISKPLVSSGDFEFVKNKGVYFYTTYPIKSTVDYTNKNYKQINDIVRAISTKKYSGLEKEFNFFFSKTGNLWTLGLKPKPTSNLTNYIKTISIDGSSYINKIEISQTNGNKTVIWFIK